MLTRSKAQAREIARQHLGRYLSLPNYRNNLLRLGFSERDLRGRGSERLLDALVALGGPEQVAERARAHLEAGADHVCIQALAADYRRVPLGPLARVAAVLELA